MHHPGVDTLTLTELKRKKLVLKDENRASEERISPIERVRSDR